MDRQGPWPTTVGHGRCSRGTLVDRNRPRRLSRRTASWDRVDTPGEQHPQTPNAPTPGVASVPTSHLPKPGLPRDRVPHPSQDPTVPPALRQWAGVLRVQVTSTTGSCGGWRHTTRLQGHPWTQTINPIPSPTTLGDRALDGPRKTGGQGRRPTFTQTTDGRPEHYRHVGLDFSPSANPKSQRYCWHPRPSQGSSGTVDSLPSTAPTKPTQKVLTNLTHCVTSALLPPPPPPLLRAVCQFTSRPAAEGVEGPETDAGGLDGGESLGCGGTRRPRSEPPSNPPPPLQCRRRRSRHHPQGTGHPSRPALPPTRRWVRVAPPTATVPEGSPGESP